MLACVLDDICKGFASMQNDFEGDILEATKTTMTTAMGMNKERKKQKNVSL